MQTPTAPFALIKRSKKFFYLLTNYTVRLLPLNFLIKKLKYLSFVSVLFTYLVIPSSAAADFLKVTAPSEISPEIAFEINLEVSALPNTKYFAKARIGNDISKLRDGQTLDQVKNIWLSDTLSWNNFPSFETNENGVWVGSIKARAAKTVKVGTGYLVVRIHAESGSNTDSATYSLNIKEAPKPEIKEEPTRVAQEEGEPVLSEFVAQPNSGDKEWVEIKNKGKGKIDLSGWKIDDDPGKSSPHVIPANTILEPGRFLVVTFDSPKLNDLADSVRLLKPDNSVVESHSYKNTVRGSSWAKNSSGSWFLTANLTPGEDNPTLDNQGGAVEEPETTNTETSNAEIAQESDTVINDLPEVLGTDQGSTATVSASFSKKTPAQNTFVPLIIVGVLFLTSAGIFFIKKKIKSGHSEISEQPL